jgi:hypothetical protein
VARADSRGLIAMEALLNRVTARFPWLTIGRLLAAIFAAALLIVFLLPNAHPISQLVTIAAVIGATAAILSGVTFWAQGRVRIARFLNARNLPFRYKAVRRYAAAVAVAGLSFLAVKHIALGIRGAQPLPGDEARNLSNAKVADTGATVPDKIEWRFNRSGKDLIPAGLPNPEQWVALEKDADSSGRPSAMTWVRHSGKDPGEWTEMFGYHDLPQEGISPREFFDQFKAGQARQCPSGTVSLIELSDTELMFEAKSGGCPHYGDVDEIDRYLFGKSDLFQMEYTVKAREMTPAQRDAGIKAVSAPRLQRPG